MQNAKVKGQRRCTESNRSVFINQLLSKKICKVNLTLIAFSFN